MLSYFLSVKQAASAADEDGMDERTTGPTTKFTRNARTRRMLDRLREGWAYRDVARAEGLSDRRVRQIVGEHVRRSEPVDEDAHAALQIERLGFALKVAGEALAKADIRAIAPFIKAIDRLDAYQTRARKAAPRPSPEADALVVKALVDRIRRGVEAEAAPARRPSEPSAAQEPVIEAEPSPPSVDPESPLAAEAPATAAEPAQPLAGPDGPIAPAAPALGAAEDAPGPVESLVAAAPPAAEARPSPPPAPAPVAPPFSRPNLSDFAFSNFSPFLRG